MELNTDRDFYVKCMWDGWDLVRVNALRFWLSSQDRTHSFRCGRVSSLTMVYTSELQRALGQTKNCSMVSEPGPQPQQLERWTWAAGKALPVSTCMLKLPISLLHKLLTLEAPLAAIPDALSCPAHPLDSSRAWSPLSRAKPLWTRH